VQQIGETGPAWVQLPLPLEEADEKSDNASTDSFHEFPSENSPEAATLSSSGSIFNAIGNMVSNLTSSILAKLDDGHSTSGSPAPGKIRKPMRSAQ